MRDYDDDFLLCRRGNLGHAWRPVGYWKEPDGVVARRLECDRCETARTDRWVRASGDRLQPTYRYTEGFQIQGLGEPVDAHDVRLEAIRRADVYANEDAMLQAMTE